MTWHEVRANWLPLRDQVHSRWEQLSHEDIDAVAGRRSHLITILQTRYRLDEASAANQADDFVRSLQVLTL